MKFQTRLTAVIILALSSQAFALSVGSEVEKNLCMNNCTSQVNVTLNVRSDKLCKKEFVDGRSVTCCEAIPSNEELNDAIVLKTLLNERSYGTCGWESEGLAAPQNPPYFCSANGCEEIEWMNEDNGLSLITAFRKANAAGACERTIYTNGIYLRKGETVSLNAYRSLGKNLPSTTISCQ